MNINFRRHKKLLLAGVVVALGVIARFALLEVPNVELMTLGALVAGVFLGGFYALAVPLAIIAVSDIINYATQGIYSGNDPIIFFTWSAWAIIGLFGLLLHRAPKTNWRFGFKFIGLGFIAILFFFVWTNFGVWLLFGMYPKTLVGLYSCYVMAIPFLKNQLVGNAIFIPLFIFTTIAAVKIYPAIKNYLKKKLPVRQ